MYLGFWRIIALKPAPLLEVGRKCASELSKSGCGLVIFMRGPDSGFLPFFRNWPALYREGLGDGAEWRARRFEWF